jgi:hypothetical protein
MMERPITQQIALSIDTVRALPGPALRRGITVGQLATRIVETTVDERMIAAVLDDGVRDEGDDDDGLGEFA